MEREKKKRKKKPEAAHRPTDQPYEPNEALHHAYVGGGEERRAIGRKRKSLIAPRRVERRERSMERERAGSRGVGERVGGKGREREREREREGGWERDEKRIKK